MPLIVSAAEDQNIMIQFLFRKSKVSPSITSSAKHPREEKTVKEWTNKLASLVEEEPLGAVNPQTEKIDDPENQPNRLSMLPFQTSLRLEGPYFTPANPEIYNTVICIVAGTGVSGAIAIAAAFSAQSSNTPSNKATSLAESTAGSTGSAGDPRGGYSGTLSKARTWRRCIIIWSVRRSDHIDLPFFKETPGLEVRSHLTGLGHDRLDAGKTISEICSSAQGDTTWVYISGPNPFIEAGEKACRRLDLPYFGARWS